MISTEEIKQVSKLIKVPTVDLTVYNKEHRDLIRNLDYRPLFYTHGEIPAGYLWALDENLNSTNHRAPAHTSSHVLSEHPSKAALSIVLINNTDAQYALLRKEIANIKRTSLRKKLIELQNKNTLVYAYTYSRYIYLQPQLNYINNVNFEGYKQFIK